MDESVSLAVVSTVATAAETDPLELPPLYASIDPDALEVLDEPDAAERSNAVTHVSFTFAGYSVTVHSTGVVAVEPLESAIAR